MRTHKHRVPQEAPGFLATFDGEFQPTGRVGCPSRMTLHWTAGQRGKPGLNADIQNNSESTRMIADPDFELLGTNAASSCSTFNAEGGITLTTAGASGDSVILLPHLDANQSAWTQVTWGTDQETEWTCWLVTGAAITAQIVWAGLKLTNTDVIATDNDSVYVRYEAGVASGKFQVNASINNTDTTTTTAVTVAASTAYLIKIRIRADRCAEVYINGDLMVVTGALTNATDLIPYVGIKASAAAAKALTVRSQSISRKYA